MPVMKSTISGHKKVRGDVMMMVMTMTMTMSSYLDIDDNGNLLMGIA